MQVMRNQTGGGHIFNMDGAGADGMPTPQYAAYGATKAGMGFCLTNLPGMPLASPMSIVNVDACHSLHIICKLVRKLHALQLRCTVHEVRMFMKQQQQRKQQ